MASSPYWAIQWQKAFAKSFHGSGHSVRTIGAGKYYRELYIVKGSDALARHYDTVTLASDPRKTFNGSLSAAYSCLLPLAEIPNAFFTKEDECLELHTEHARCGFHSFFGVNWACTVHGAQDGLSFKSTPSTT